VSRPYGEYEVRIHDHDDSIIETVWIGDKLLDGRLFAEEWWKKDKDHKIMIVKIRPVIVILPSDEKKNA
jgi:hypothetical protein